tara:strand:+ start:202 stop:393 length:192 start_codon:yes stop_codon:yes gene_type:complete
MQKLEEISDSYNSNNHSVNSGKFSGSITGIGTFMAFMPDTCSKITGGVFIALGAIDYLVDTYL